MATIDMGQNWNIRIKGLKISDMTIPVVEVYFNLGYAVNVGDVLNFGQLNNFGYGMQVRFNTIGDSWDTIVSGYIKKPSTYTPQEYDITDSETGLRFQQTVTNNNTVIGTAVYLHYGIAYAGFSYPSPMFGYEKEGYSPLILLHDEFSDKIITGGNSTLSPVFYSWQDSLLKIKDGYLTANSFPVVQEQVTREALFEIHELIGNPLIVINPSDSDPYNPNGQPAGGDGEEQTTDNMDDETIPTISAVDTGFVTLYKPSISQMNALASYMWGAFDIEQFKKIFANPMDVILGLSILPGIVPSGGSATVKVGNISTGISMTKVGNQYVKHNCGSVTIKRKWGAFLDYSPYTKAFIYLPFIGIQPIDVDEIMNKTVSVVYNIDVLSGGCCAFVKVGGTTLYSYTGQCAASVPVTSRDWSTMINGVLGAVSGVTGTIGSIASGNVAGAISGVAAVAQNVMGAKPTYQRSGSMGGMGGMMGIKTPYIIIERPVQAVPGYQNQIIGYPSFITRLIGDFKGYTEIEQCHLENIPCTGDELIEIENILKTGVIL